MATISDVKIGNLALSHIGANATIETFADTTSTAKTVALWYDFSREEVLESFDWSFARKRQALALHAIAAPATEWFYRYQYPADTIVTRQFVNPLGPQADAVPYRIEMASDGTKSILTDLEDAEMIYTFNQEDTTVFSSLFVEALSFMLASKIAHSITGKRALAQQMRIEYLQLLLMAPASNANEEILRGPRDVDWIRDRA